jgi:hypothetical protein
MQASAREKSAGLLYQCSTAALQPGRFLSRRPRTFGAFRSIQHEGGIEMTEQECFVFCNRRFLYEKSMYNFRMGLKSVGTICYRADGFCRSRFQSRRLDHIFLRGISIPCENLKCPQILAEKNIIFLSCNLL